MFRNVAAFARAASDEGKHWISSYRKALSASATVSGQWFDYSYAGGNPIPNYYASSPLEAAQLERDKGIIMPRIGPDERLWLHRWTAMSAAASATSTTNANQSLYLMDYLLYYPFVDMDAAGEDQVMTQTTGLSRYTDGVGVQMMVVAQSPTVGGGRFTITYTDADDVQQTTTSMFCGAAQPAGALVNAVLGTGGLTPFVPLNVGVRGVKRVDTVNFSVANGGLCAVVLVRPLDTLWLREESRRTTTGTIESFGDAAEVESISGRAGVVEIKDGAFIGILGKGSAGSLASSVLVGTIETVWS
ncbi:MAG: hypothetical protein KA200_00145 [Burkholderiales bacterium]|nr:hypothetical protein [Burkholderiales bacterium]